MRNNPNVEWSDPEKLNDVALITSIGNLLLLVCTVVLALGSNQWAWLLLFGLGAIGSGYWAARRPCVQRMGTQTYVLRHFELAHKALLFVGVVALALGF